MTVSTSIGRAGPYTGNGTTTSFTVTFEFEDAADIKVYIDHTLKTLTTHYSVSGGDGETGTVTFVNAPAAGTSVLIYDDPPITQEVDYTENDPFPAETHEGALDKLTRLARRLSSRISRTLHISDSNTTVTNMELPEPEALNLIGWDADAAALANYSTTEIIGSIATVDWMSDVFDGDGATVAFSLTRAPGVASNCDVSIAGATQRPATDYTVSGTTITFTTAPPIGTDNILVRYGSALAAFNGAASSVSFIQSGSGAVSRDSQDKMRETFSVKDFGALGDGTTDDGLAILATIKAASAARLAGAVKVGVEFPVGKYKTTLPIPCIASVVMFCRVPWGAVIVPSGTMSEALYSATLSGGTFTTTVGTAFNTSVSGAGVINIFVDAQVANCTITNCIASFNGAAEGMFERLYVSTDINTIDGIEFDHCVSVRLDNLRADKGGAATGGVGITLSGQTNASVLREPQIEGDWAVGILMGGVSNMILGGVVESSPTVGVKVTGEKVIIDGCWLEGIVSYDIQLGDTGSTAYATDIRNTLHGGAATNMLKIVEATNFFWQKSCRVQAGVTPYTNSYDAPASAAVCNGTIQLYGDPETFTVAGVNLSGKGAINLEVYGTNDTSDAKRYALYSSASGNAVLSPGRDIATFTPSLLLGGAATGMTYAADGQIGAVWTIGKMVFFTLRMALTAKGSSTGVVTVSGLPYTSRNATNLNYTFAIETSNVDMNAGGGFNRPTAYMAANSAVISLREVGDNVAATALTEADIANDSVILITGSYMI